MKTLPGCKRLALAAMLALCSAAQAQPQTNPAFTPQQRLEIVQILRDALRTDPSILRDAVQAAQNDDAARLDAATRAAVAANRTALVANPTDPVGGNPSGDVTLVEFYDTRCPYCRAALPEINALLHADPNLRIVYKDLPVLGPNSVREAKGLIAAQSQGGYLRMQDAVMNAPAPLSEDGLVAAATRAGLDGTRFAHDMADPATTARIDANLKLAAALHVEGTPVFVIGGQVIPGAVPLARLQQAVESARLN